MSEGGTYEIEVRQTLVVTVPVTAASEAEALVMVARRDFPLPPRDEWAAVRDLWGYRVLEDDPEPDDITCARADEEAEQ